MTSSLISSTSSADARQLGLPNIALAGKAGAGKTTSADLLTELGYQKHSFASALKDIAIQIWGDGARTDRDKLQRLGAAVRDIDTDAWVRLLLLASLGTDTYLNGRLPIVIDDCRFENEWFALKAQGFVIVRIVTAPVSIRIARLKANGKWQSEEQLNHVSETAIDHLKADYTIDNDSTIDDLYDELINVIIKERKRR